MKASIIGFAASIFLALSCVAGAAPSLTASIGNRSAYFLDARYLRHHRYELDVEQLTTLSDRWHSRFEARVRADLGMTGELSPQKYSSTVRNDEAVEAEPRVAMLDYLGDNVRARMGLMSFDWTESLFPFTNNLLAPLDLRHGATEMPSQIRVPMVMVDVNHRIGDGNLNWVVVPVPKPSRFPKGANGYGYYEYLSRVSSPFSVNLIEGSIPIQHSECEAGVRYWYRWDALELTPLIYYGHQRAPSHSISAATATTVNVVQSYPRVLTFGLLSTLGMGPWVARASVLVEPSRKPTVIMNAAANTDYDERLVQSNLGFDFVISKHLKIYSELSSHWRDLSSVNIPTGGKTHISNSDDHVASVRLTNESLKDVQLELEGTYTFPKQSFLLSPRLAWTLQSRYELTLGAQMVHSESADSPLDMLRDTDQIYVSVKYLFKIR